MITIENNSSPIKLENQIGKLECSMEARTDRQFGRYNWIIGTMLAGFIALTVLIRWLYDF